ncbi:MAG: ATP-dependent RNA helicase HrpA, partial [Gammaproteobacteria bacterium]|nr:ATP-dependent RNA helicase HrpA [Gammaproteobacteria bacterium]
MSLEFSGVSSSLTQLFDRLDEIMLADRRSLRKRLHGLQRRERSGKPIDRSLAEVEQALERSRQRLEQRRAAVPVPDYPEELPVSARRAAIAAAIEEHQVVVVAGETGSGKTTQLPKICLELGRGVVGTIGHTQPRRIAARSVANRIAEELHTELGQTVGFKIRFTERSSSNSLIKLMTDGILLAEVQSDPLLEQYDTLIIDEAHERSLNIDFLLGYLKQLLPKRPDLKVIITSATINTKRFAEFFGGAPVVEVSGRTYPVELRYRPLLDEEDEKREADPQQGILDAVDELARLDPLGDILIFLPGERDIREAADALARHRMRDTEVVPLFSRLSAAEQDRVFRPHRGRRIVLATNVAETSLTVPGIKFVIDTGMARISRYSHRTKVQRLPIEPVSRASANQRAGRCGRVSAGTCIRLYSEEDFLARPEYTDPEIRRTNLASVILQMMLLGLGDIEAFPFIDPPDRRYISDGFRLLHELGAVDRENRITKEGRMLARLPVDPRIGRMLLAAARERSLHEVLIIASALTIQDPRERPLDAQQAADEKHARYVDEKSDFTAYLNLWGYYHEQARHLSNSKLRKLCRKEFINYLRMREWHDIHGQLLAQVRNLELTPNKQEADYEAIHRALLAGLLSNIAHKDEREQKGPPPKKQKRKPFTEYLGARNLKPAIFPGSSQAKRAPKWIMAAELVETSRLFARDVAQIDPAWIEPLAGDLVKRTWLEPHWEKRAGQVAAFEQVTLFGLLVVPRRKVNYGPIDPVLSRELFIRHALVEGELRCDAPFFNHNRELLEEVALLEAKSRRRDILVDEETLFAFYDERLPEKIYSAKGFDKWRKQAEREVPRLLFLERESLMQHEAEDVTERDFPPVFDYQGMPLPLDYHFEPGHPADGVTVALPLAALAQLRPEPFEWLVPGLIKEKLIALIKTLPKAIRRNYVPAVNFVEAALEAMPPYSGDLLEQFARQLHRISGVAMPDGAWQPQNLPPHLRMNFRVIDQAGKVIDEGRELAALQGNMAGKVRQSLHTPAESEWERGGIKEWDVEALPESVQLERHGLKVNAFPAYSDEGKDVSLKLFESHEAAEAEQRRGVMRLFMLANQDKIKYLKKNLPGIKNACLHYVAIGKCDELNESIIRAAVATSLLGDGAAPRTRRQYRIQAEQARDNLVENASRIAELAAETLAAYHRINKQLKGAVQPQWLNSIADIGEQLEHLLPPGFVATTPPEWLPRLPRYLQAVEKR